MRKSTKVELRCVNCNIIFFAKPRDVAKGQKCCSKQCSLQHRSKPNTECSNCGKPLRRKECNLKRFKVFYCSTTCQSEHRIKHALTSPRSERGVMQRLKTAAKKARGNVCQVCKWDRANCDVHRILPQSEGGTNNPENLIVVCPNCHRMAHDNEISQDELTEIVNNSLE